MSHPLIDNADKLSTEELTAKITDLNKKLGIAARTGNGHLCDQIRMALNTFQNVYQDRLQQEYQKNSKDLDRYTSKIDVS